MAIIIAVIIRMAGTTHVMSPCGERISDRVRISSSAPDDNMEENLEPNSPRPLA